MKKILLFILFSINICNAEKIKLYTFYTPSHTRLFFQWFLPSLQDEFELVVECHDQECASGCFMSKGWIKTMLFKVDLVIRAIKENWNKVFIHSDVDIQFFKSFQNEIPDLIKEYDMVIQQDNQFGQACAGFFISRGNKRTLDLWQTIRTKMIENPLHHDQYFLNDIIRKPNYTGISWNYLPITFFSAGVFTGKRWEPGHKLEIPENIVLHHANWTRGVHNKISQLTYVRDTITKRIEYQCEDDVMK